jgi:hypothetical protein
LVHGLSVTLCVELLPTARVLAEVSDADESYGHAENLGKHTQEVQEQCGFEQPEDHHEGQDRAEGKQAEANDY